MWFMPTTFLSERTKLRPGNARPDAPGAASNHPGRGYLRRSAPAREGGVIWWLKAADNVRQFAQNDSPALSSNARFMSASELVLWQPFSATNLEALPESGESAAV